MKIISRFKDYYDYIAHQYGGGDPKVIYKRDFVVPDEDRYGLIHESTLRLETVMPSQPKNFKSVRDGKSIYHEFECLVVMNRLFWIERISECNICGEASSLTIRDWHITQRPILNEKWGYGIFAKLTPEERAREPNTMRKQQEEEWEETRKWGASQGQTLSVCTQICKAAKAPVLVLDAEYRRVRGRVPKLGELGLVQYYSAEQLYQELAMFISNELAPFVDPPSPMTNIEKVVSHGFDKKKSFRHR